MGGGDGWGGEGELGREWRQLYLNNNKKKELLNIDLTKTLM